MRVGAIAHLRANARLLLPLQLTETCSSATVGSYDDNQWSVGRVLSSCKVALRDWEEGNYRNSDAENPAVRMPRGVNCPMSPVWK